MTIVEVRSSWSAINDQCLDNLLHINRPNLENGDISQQPTVLRPDNASGSERCRIMLTAHDNMVLTELRIGCSARHMEVYEGQDSYLETVKGKARESNGTSSLYWHTFVCGRPLENMSVKFVSLQDKEKLDLYGIWLTLEERHQTPDNSKLVNMQEVDRMLLNDQAETGGQAMLRQLISSLPANAASSTPPSQTSPLLPMMLQLFTQSAMSQRPDTRQTDTPDHPAKQLLCEEANKNERENIENKNREPSISDKSNTSCCGDGSDPAESHEKCSSEDSSEIEKEQSNIKTISLCSCGANLEARLTHVMEDVELRLQAKFQEMDDYRQNMDKKFEMLENRFLDLMKENNSSHNENS